MFQAPMASQVSALNFSQVYKIVTAQIEIMAKILHGTYLPSLTSLNFLKQPERVGTASVFP